MDVQIPKRSIIVSGHRTSVSLEDEFWAELKKVAHTEDVSLNTLLSQLDELRPADSNFSSFIRVWLFKRVQNPIPSAFGPAT